MLLPLWGADKPSWMISREVEALMHIIHDNIMTNEQSICVHVSMMSLGYNIS